MFAEERLIGFLHALGQHRGRLSGRHERVQEHDNPHIHQLYQISTLNAIMEGAYDGTVTIEELREHGDFGLGTFNGLNGEMIMIDGLVYQILIDGQVRLADDQERTPFAVVQFFEPDWQDHLDGPLVFDDLSDLLADHLPSTNYFSAVRIDGQMAAVRARSVARQQKPYRPLIEVVKEQQVFDFVDITGTIVGFRFPEYAQGVNMPGWHLHFISQDRQHGGHVLDFTLAQGHIAVEDTNEFFMELPKNTEFAQADLNKDQSDAIARAER